MFSLHLSLSSVLPVCDLGPSSSVDWGQETQKEIDRGRMGQGVGYCVFKEERDQCGESWRVCSLGPDVSVWIQTLAFVPPPFFFFL